ncbi:hypothetical protein Taro_022055, partial [Colocasia esculenta]|nr:hypothetical protein [Colocasia esculenta]
MSLHIFGVVWRSSWRLGEQDIAHTKPFFFPVASAATCTDSHLEVDQRSSWRLGEQEIAHTKPFFFPVASAATCTDSHLEVDQ